MEHHQARTIVLGVLHQLWCAALSLTFAAWAQRFCVVNAVAAEVRDLHMRRAFALVILSNYLRLACEPHQGTTASNGALKSSTRFSLTLQQTSPRAFFVVG